MNVKKFYYDVLWVNWIVIGSSDFSEYLYEYRIFNPTNYTPNHDNCLLFCDAPPICFRPCRPFLSK